jgi:hypothetical protein
VYSGVYAIFLYNDFRYIYRGVFVRIGVDLVYMRFFYIMTLDIYIEAFS